jgi:hypothetical protein
MQSPVIINMYITCNSYIASPVGDGLFLEMQCLWVQFKHRQSEFILYKFSMNLAWDSGCTSNFKLMLSPYPSLPSSRAHV